MTGCDPIYPTGELRVEKMQPLSQGASMNIEIIYPSTEGTLGYVLGWKEQCVEIISGDDIISVSGLTITGLKSGVASIKVVQLRLFRMKILHPDMKKKCILS